eukprot:3245710-Rhodomonas_salina.2
MSRDVMVPRLMYSNADTTGESYDRLLTHSQRRPHTCHAMAGSDRRHFAIGLRARYMMSSTDIPYGATTDDVDPYIQHPQCVCRRLMVDDRRLMVDGDDYDDDNDADDDADDHHHHQNHLRIIRIVIIIITPRNCRRNHHYHNNNNNHYHHQHQP